MKTLGYKAPRISNAEYNAIKLLLQHKRTSQSDVARQVGRTKQTINRIANSKSYIEYKRENDPRLKGGDETMEQKRTNKTWTKEQIFVLLGMADAGNTNMAIADTLERTTVAINMLRARIKNYREGRPGKDRINRDIYKWVDEYYSVPRVAGVAKATEDKPMPTVSVSQDPLDKLDSALESLKSILAEVIVAEVDKRISAERAEYEKKIADLEQTQRGSIKGMLSGWRS